MYERVLIFLLSFIALSYGQGKCPDPNDSTATVNCTLVPGCNFQENGTLTTLATQCSNELADDDCAQLFPCDSAGTPACRDPADVGGETEDLYPYVRAPACNDPDLQNVALQCAKQCALCCLAPEYNCDDDTKSPVDCELNKGKCKDANWTNIMSQYCPKTCGLCTNGTCRDLNSGCNTMTALCKHVDWIDYMTTNCARTCDVCSTDTGSNCSDIATNCVQNANLCTDSVYRELMSQQCCATCSGASGGGSGGGSCSDSDSNCANWVNNGFCSNSFYTSDQKRQYCGRSCNLC